MIGAGGINFKYEYCISEIHKHMFEDIVTKYTIMYSVKTNAIQVLYS